MSVDLTQELHDLFKMYNRSIDNSLTKQEEMLPSLVYWMQKFCTEYQDRKELEERLDLLEQKLHELTEDVGDDE